MKGGSAVALIGDGAALLRGAGIENPRGEARLLLEIASGLSRESLIANPERLIARDAAHVFRLMLRRRMNCEPIAYIRGEKEFFSRPFKVTPDVLIPRPDSECLIERALAAFPHKDAPLRVLDLGTGSGCLLLTVLGERPRAWGVGIDLSARALEVARANAEALGLAARARFLRADWLSALKGSFDLILANPPYIGQGEMAGLAADVVRFEPRLALAGGADGLDAYRALLPALAQNMSKTGMALVEVGAGQAEAVNLIAAGFGLSLDGMAEDLSGRTRGLSLRRSAATKKLLECVP